MCGNQGEKLVLALISFAIVYQMFLPPVVGLADNGDFIRVKSPYMASPRDLSETDRHWHYFHRFYVHGKHWPQYFISSEKVLFAIAQLINSVGSKRGDFDIVFLGGVHAVLYLLAVAAMLRAARTLSKPGRWAFWLVLMVVATDVGYIAYFNSFYMEAASLVFLCHLVAAGWLLASSAQPRLAVLVWYFVSAVLFVTAKTQNCPLGLLLAFFGILSYGPEKRVKRRIACLVLALVLCGISVYMYREGTRKFFKAQVVWNAVFFNLLPHSPDPQRDLAEFGLDEKWQKFIGQHSMAKPDEVPVVPFRREFGGLGNVLRFYLRHPGRLADLFARCARGTFILRVEYLGNFEQKWGYERGAKSQAFALWSDLRAKFIPKSIWFLIVAFLAVVLLAVLEGLRSGSWSSTRARLSALVTLLTFMAAGQFGVAVLTEGESDLVKHLFLFNALCDMVLAIAVVWMSAGSRELACRFARRWDRSADSA